MAQEKSTTFPPDIGTPQWRQQFESHRVLAKLLENKLADDRQYLADPMMRADDSATLQHVKNSLHIFELEEEVLSNPSPERVAEINKERSEFWSTEREAFAFLQRLGQQQNQRFEQARKISEMQQRPDVKPVQPTENAAAAADIDDLARQVAKIRANPEGHPTMSIKEAAHAIGRSKSTVHRRLEKGTFIKIGGRVQTASVVAYLEKEPAD